MHLVVSVAKHMYLAVAKGGLSETNCLIVPIQHVPASIFLPEEALSDIHNYKISLCACFAKQDKVLILQLKFDTLGGNLYRKIHSHEI